MSAENKGGVTGTTKASSALGLIAAAVLAVLVNVTVARHYARWDVTTAHIYTLSAPTKETLRSLSEPVDVYVLLSSGDPLTTSVKHLLTAYESETTRLRIHYLDPDRSPAEFVAFQQKYDILAGKTQDGRVVADATMVIVRGEARWFLTPTDLVEASESDEGRARPKLEQGITTGIRQVLGGERTKVCFTRGHDESSLDDPGTRGLGELKHRLDRDNVTSSAFTLSGPEATKEPISSCDAVIVAGPQVPFSDADADALVRYVSNGGSALVLVNPQPDGDKKRVVDSGLERVAALGGIALRHDLVFEKDPESTVPKSFGEAFFARPKEHPITKGFGPEVIEGGARILVVLAQSLTPIATSAVHPQSIVETSKDAFGMVDFFSWADQQGAPTQRAADHPGPLALAMAAELPSVPAAKSPRGSRLVVIGSSAPIHGQSWEEPSFRGGAYLVESAISWLTSRPQIVDIPQKPSVQAGLHLTDASLSQVRNYVTIYIPLATALCGIAVWLRRRSTERK